MKIPKSIIIMLVGAVLIGGAALAVIKQRVAPYEPAPTTNIPTEAHAPAENLGNSTSANPTPSDTTPPAEPPKTTKTTLLLPIPFTPQAPTANWDQIHNEGCEEASAIMAGAYFAGRKEAMLPADFVESEFAKLTKWQDDNFGYHLDSTAAETAKMIEAVYGLKTKLIPNFTTDQIKQELAQNHVVIFPAAGRKLGNPNFRSPGPIYHMLILKGYTKDGYITNDPGTRRGLNYPYSFSTINNAGADWDHSTGTIDDKKKLVIVVWK